MFEVAGANSIIERWNSIIERCLSDMPRKASGVAARLTWAFARFCFIHPWLVPLDCSPKAPASRRKPFASRFVHAVGYCCGSRTGRAEL